MSYQTHTPAEWAEVVFLATGGTASVFVPWLLLVDSVSARDFSLVPVARRALDSRAGDRLCVEIVRAKGTARAAADRARHIPRDAAITAAALLMLLTSSAPEATR